MWTRRTGQPMPWKIFLFTQPGCLNCEVMKIFLEAKELVFEERDMSDSAARLELLETYHSHTAPTLVILTRSRRRSDRRLRPRPP